MKIDKQKLADTEMKAKNRSLKDQIITDKEEINVQKAKIDSLAINVMCL